MYKLITFNKQTTINNVAIKTVNYLIVDENKEGNSLLNITSKKELNQARVFVKALNQTANALHSAEVNRRYL